MSQAVEIDLVAHGGAGFRTFVNLANLWQLTVQEQADMLALDVSTFDDLKSRTMAHERVEAPMDVVVRIGSVLSIYASLSSLLNADRTGAWIRSRNSAPLFGGKAALELMTTGDLADLDSVAKFLLANVHNPASAWPPEAAPGIAGDDYRVVLEKTSDSAEAVAHAQAIAKRFVEGGGDVSVEGFIAHRNDLHT